MPDERKCRFCHKAHLLADDPLAKYNHPFEPEPAPEDKKGAQGKNWYNAENLHREDCAWWHRMACNCRPAAPPSIAQPPKIANYDTATEIVDHIVGLVADDGSITPHSRALAIDYVETRLDFSLLHSEEAEELKSVAAAPSGEGQKLPTLLFPEMDELDKKTRPLIMPSDESLTWLCNKLERECGSLRAKLEHAAHITKGLQAELEQANFSISKLTGSYEREKEQKKAAERSLAEILEHPFAEDCQECGIGRSDAWKRARALQPKPTEGGEK